MKKGMAFMFAVVAAAGLMAGCSGGNAGAATAGSASVQAAGTEAKTAGEEAKMAGTVAVAAESPAAAGKTGSGEKTEILVAAAASLKNAYEEELIPMFEAQNPGVTVKGTYDSSGKLQTQIEEGMEADVFMSAAPKQMKALDQEGLIAGDTMTDLLENKIVLIVPADSKEEFGGFGDIEKAASIALGDPASVPVGQYAEEALTNLGIWDKIQDKVSFGTNVTEVLNQVAAGSADAGIVYATDAYGMADQVKIVAEAPEGSLKSKVIYPVAVVEGTAHEDEARAFVDFLKTNEAMKVFESYGFSRGN